MNHREIYDTVSRVIAERASRGSFRMMDLGCGNARCIAPILRQYPPTSYQGVDLSEAALGEATEILLGVEGVELNCSDLLGHVESAKSPWDVVFSGFAVHHLSLGEKARLFRALAAIVSTDGFFLMVDVVRDEGVSRDEHVASYTAMMRREWHGIPTEALEEGCAHVSGFDFPATTKELFELAQVAGFTHASQLCRHANHAVLLFSQRVGPFPV